VVPLKGNQVRLKRGDLVTIEVRHEMIPEGAEIIFDRLKDVARHPQWGELRVGANLLGTINTNTQGGVFVRVNAIDGFVPFSRANSWRASPPIRGTTFSFEVVGIDPARGQLDLMPVEQPREVGE
jgi:ribosomal protein S1